MAFRQQRFHDHMPFADSYSQDMEFWRQRVHREAERDVTTPSFNKSTLDHLPCDPFMNSAGMLKGPGVNPRMKNTALGVLAPDLAAYRAVVPNSPMARPPIFDRPGPQIQRPYWQIARTPYSLGASDLSPAHRAALGAARFAATAPTEPMTRAPAAFVNQGLTFFESPNQRICASIRRGMPRARLDARMYAASPG